MKKNSFIFAAVTIGFLIFGVIALYIQSPSAAQKKYQTQWEYAAVTFTNVPFSSENQPVITAIANVCFLQLNGCQNEEVRAELVYAKFLQDFRLENTNNSKNLAFNRARELAYVKALARLGSEGWEITGQPSVNFDSYILDFQGNYVISQASKEVRPNVYFKRMKQ